MTPNNLPSLSAQARELLSALPDEQWEESDGLVWSADGNTCIVPPPVAPQPRSVIENRARFIAFARNHLAEILDRCDRAEREAERLRQKYSEPPHRFD